MTLWQQPADASTPAEIVAELPTSVRYLVWTPDGRYLIAAGDWSAYAPVWAVDVGKGTIYSIADEALLLSLPPTSLRLPPDPFDDQEF